MRKGFLICEEIRKYFPIYEEAISHIWLCNRSTLFPYLWGKFYFLFHQCVFQHLYPFLNSQADRFLEGYRLLKYQRGHCILFSVVFTPPPTSHYGSVWLLYLSSLYSKIKPYRGAGLLIHMIVEVSWEPQRRRAWDSKYLIPRCSVSV